MSSDQFALWLENRQLFKQLTNDTLESKQNEIISFFGGFRSMINLCLSHQFSIDLPTHQQLFILLNDFANQQNSENTNICAKSITTTNKSNLLTLLSDISISSIFTFLNQNDHISFQKVCKTLTVIGRRKESINDKNNFISHALEFPHKLSFITNCIQSENPTHWRKSIIVTKQVIPVNDMKNVDIIRYSGIIQSFLTLCKKSMTTNPKISIDILDLLLNNLLNTDTMNIFIKYNFFSLLKDTISNYNGQLIEQSLLILLYLQDIYKLNSIQIVLNNMDFVSVLVNNIRKFNHRNYEDIILLVIGNLICHSSFDCDKNVNIISKLVNIELFECIKIYVQIAKEWETDQQENKNEIWTHNNEIVNLYQKINQKYEVEFNIYDSEKMSLILFLLKHTKIQSINCIIDKWLNIDNILLLDKNILHFIIRKFGKLKCFKEYLKLLIHINEFPAIIERQRTFDIMKDYFFSDNNHISEKEYLREIAQCLNQHFDMKNNMNHCIDFMEEFTNLHAKSFVYFNTSIIEKMQKKLMSRFFTNSQSFGQMMIHQLNTNTKRTLKFILNTAEFDGVYYGLYDVFAFIITANKYKIFKTIINCCYSKYNILAIKCCLKYSK
eukprot:242285_1